MAEVMVDGLLVRYQPRLSSDPVILPVADAHFEYILGAGERILRFAEAGTRDGYTWWEIFGTPAGWNDITVHGYVAGGPDDSWLRNVEPQGCPEKPTLDQLRALALFMRVACYPESALTFTAYSPTIPKDGYGGACGVGFSEYTMVGLMEPLPVRVDWLQCENINHNWVNNSGNSDSLFLLHYNPAVLAAPDILAIQGDRFTITGHFADPASADCATGISSEAARSAAYWDCAEKFVVDRLKPAP